MQQVERYTAGGQYLNVGVVQGNVDQNEKWAPDQKRATLEKYLGLSEEVVSTNGADVIVWPETALPFGHRSWIGKRAPGKLLNSIDSR